MTAATAIVVYAKFWFWRADIVRGLAAHSVVVQTERGPIEYAMIGTGRPALFLLGGRDSRRRYSLALDFLPLRLAGNRVSPNL